MLFYHQVSFVLVNHVMAGVIAAFIAFPLAIFAKKGSKLHVAAGRIFVISFIVICLTGYHIDADQIFKIPFISASLCNIYQNHFCYAKYFHNNVSILRTACINTVALYLCVSGWRLANQHHLGNKTKKSALFDACFAILEIFIVIVFVACVFYNFYLQQHFHDVSKLWYYLAVIMIASVPLWDAARDLYFAVTLKQAKFWWKMHMRKMLMAEYGLILAFLLRCTELSNHWLVAAITIAFFALYLKFVRAKPVNKINFIGY